MMATSFGEDGQGDAQLIRFSSTAALSPAAAEDRHRPRQASTMKALNSSSFERSSCRGALHSRASAISTSMLAYPGQEHSSLLRMARAAPLREEVRAGFGGYQNFSDRTVRSFLLNDEGGFHKDRTVRSDQACRGETDARRPPGHEGKLRSGGRRRPVTLQSARAGLPKSVTAAGEGAEAYQTKAGFAAPTADWPPTAGGRLATAPIDRRAPWFAHPPGPAGA